MMDFATAMMEAEKGSDVSLDVLVEVACGGGGIGGEGGVIEDGPRGDSIDRKRDMLRKNPLLTTSLADAVRNVREVLGEDFS